MNHGHRTSEWGKGKQQSMADTTDVQNGHLRTGYCRSSVGTQFCLAMFCLRSSMSWAPCWFKKLMSMVGVDVGIGALQTVAEFFD